MVATGLKNPILQKSQQKSLVPIRTPAFAGIPASRQPYSVRPLRHVPSGPFHSSVSIGGAAGGASSFGAPPQFGGGAVSSSGRSAGTTTYGAGAAAPIRICCCVTIRGLPPGRPTKLSPCKTAFAGAPCQTK